MAELDGEDQIEDLENDNSIWDEGDEDTSTPTLEDYNRIYSEKRIAEKRLAKLEKDMAKKIDNSKQENPRELLKSILEEERFYEKNPEALEYKEKIEFYRIKWLSLNESFVLASSQDKWIEEKRGVYWKQLVQWNQSNWDWIKILSIQDYDRLSTEELNKYNSEMKSKYWVVKFK